jgi:peptide/nickel transport system ATP-binding protein/oligopeptide transport system ATP-binding protein
MLALREKRMNASILRAENIKKSYPVSRGMFQKSRDMHAVRDVSLHLEPGKTLGLVGESGCGKSTLGRVLVGLEPASDGKIFYKDRQIWNGSKTEFNLRQKIQMIFQDPFSSLNPRLKIKNIIAEGLQVRARKQNSREDIDSRVAAIMEKTGLSPEYRNRYPHEFSGGQRQRVAIARVLAMDPEVIVCDEPVSALDVSIQAQIINLLRRMQKEMQLSMLFISHDLSVINNISHFVAVMYMGEILETGPRFNLFSSPAHPYTRALLSAVPVADPGHKSGRILLKGEPPSPLDPPQGCLFHPRCPRSADKCTQNEPHWSKVGDSHFVRCFFPTNI